MSTLEDPIEGATHTEIGGLVVDEVPVGESRVKRVVYPPGWVWSEAMKPITGTDSCRHAHVGFLAQGSLAVRFTDGCEIVHSAPDTIAVEPGHDAWVVGDERVVLLQVDAGPQTVERLGLQGLHHVCTGSHAV